MKHTLKITLLLVLLFIVAQLVGLITITKYIKPEKTITDTGEEITTIHYEDTVVGPQPEITQKSYSFIPITIAILIGTAVLLLLIKFQLRRIWKIWFFIAVFITLAISFGVYTNNSLIAFAIALALAGWRILRPNIFVHNITEVFIYTGIAIIALPFLNLTSASLLLVIISIYDIYAVWKSKHMVKMAKFQTENRLFAGLFMEYEQKQEKKEKIAMAPSSEIKKEIPTKSAILGGGDIAFPLMFSSAILEYLITHRGLTKTMAFYQTLFIPFFVAIALALLLVKGKRNKFYPAMPFLSIGCFIGYLAIIFL